MRKQTIAALMLFVGVLHANHAVLLLNKPEDFSAPQDIKISGDALLLDKPAVWLSKTLPVEPGKSYRLQGEFKLVGGMEPTNFIFASCQRTEDNRIISGSQVWTVPGSETELTEPVSIGATKLRVKDISKWNIDAKDRMTIALLAFYADADGRQEDLPNAERSSSFAAVRPGDGHTEIEVKRPLNQAYAAGTPVRLHLDREFCGSYPGFKRLTSEWQKLDFTLKPMPSAPPYVTSRCQIWPGAARVGLRFMLWPNPKSFPQGGGILMRNLSISTQ